MQSIKENYNKTLKKQLWFYVGLCARSVKDFRTAKTKCYNIHVHKVFWINMFKNKSGMCSGSRLLLLFI